MKKYILTLDEGTTSARAILFDKKGLPISVSQHEFKQIYPLSGYVEHDPIEIYSAQYSALSEAIILAKATAKDIASIGITNQRETVVIWEKDTGNPIYNAIVWQCRRTSNMCDNLRNVGIEEYVKNTTGLKLDAYFSATKIRWILDNVKDAQKRAEAGELLFGTVDTWLMWKLSNGRIHATDITNASRTMLFNIHKMCWDEKLLGILNIPKCILPEVKPSGSYYGDVEIMGEDIPICGVAGDQQAALFGQKCFNKGDIKNTYGTGCFLLMNTGKTPVKSSHGLLTTPAATLDNEPYQYALEGSVFIGGAVIQWLRDEMKIIKSASESEVLARKVESSNGVYIVPAFSGLGAPYWDMYSRGTICGLTRGSNRNHIVRAALESIAYQSNDLISAMQSDCDIPITAIKVDGGAAANSFLMQFQSDISGIRVVRPNNTESTALGAAFLSGLTCGFFKSKDELVLNENATAVFVPEIDTEKRKAMLNGWINAVESAKKFKVE